LTIDCLLQLSELALLGFGLEPEVRPLIKFRTHPRRFSPARLSKLLEYLRRPLDVVEHANRLLGIDDVLGDARNFLLVRTPGAGRVGDGSNVGHDLQLNPKRASGPYRTGRSLAVFGVVGAESTAAPRAWSEAFFVDDVAIAGHLLIVENLSELLLGLRSDRLDATSPFIAGRGAGWTPIVAFAQPAKGVHLVHQDLLNLLRLRRGELQALREQLGLAQGPLFTPLAL